MRYLKINDDQSIKYPYKISLLKKENPNISFPDIITEDILKRFNVYEVYTMNKPTLSIDEELLELEPKLIDGKWFRQYKVIKSINSDSTLGDMHRIHRNKLLQKTDWTQGKDIPDEISNKWAIYRQQLRDITQQSGFPENIEWPSEPNGD